MWQRGLFVQFYNYYPNCSCYIILTGCEYHFLSSLRHFNQNLHCKFYSSPYVWLNFILLPSCVLGIFKGAWDVKERKNLSVYFFNQMKLKRNCMPTLRSCHSLPMKTRKTAENYFLGQIFPKSNCNHLTFSINIFFKKLLLDQSVT